jgi:hypothetical protein
MEKNGKEVSHMYPIYHPTNGSGSTFPILSGSFRGGGSATKPILNLLEHL